MTIASINRDIRRASRAWAEDQILTIGRDLVSSDQEALVGLTSYEQRIKAAYLELLEQDRAQRAAAQGDK